MRKDKMEIMVDLARKQDTAIAKAVRASMLTVYGAAVVIDTMLEKALTAAGFFVSKEHKIRSVQCTVCVRDPNGDVVWANGKAEPRPVDSFGKYEAKDADAALGIIARGTTQAPGLKPLSDLTAEEVEQVGGEALLQAVEAKLREDVLAAKKKG